MNRDYQILLEEVENTVINKDLKKPREVPNFDNWIMDIAEVVKTRSKDPSRQVGAVLVTLSDNRIVSTGYNGLIAGANDNIDWSDRPFIHSIVIHAEQNCLLYNKQSGLYKMYITTSPCKECLKMLAASGIKKIIYKNDYKDISEVSKLCFYYNIDLIKM